MDGQLKESQTAASSGHVQSGGSVPGRPDSAGPLCPGRGGRWHEGAEGLPLRAARAL